MSRLESAAQGRVPLVDALDHLLNRGVVLSGESTISLAGTDLIYLRLSLLLSSVETLVEESSKSAPGYRAGQAQGSLGLQAPRGASVDAPERRPGLKGEGHVKESPRVPNALPSPAASAPGGSMPGEAKAEGPEQGLGRLVLTVVELLRQLLERQAIRRMAGGRLPEEQVDRMGQALMELEAKMVELREVFQLTEDDLNLDLGPIGRLV